MSPRLTPMLPLLVAAFALPSASLMAAPVEEAVPTASVSYDDLDLANPAGAATLKARLASAVKSVCGEADARDLHEMSRVATCRRTALAGAQPQVEVAMAKAQTSQRYAQAGSSLRSSAR